MRIREETPEEAVTIAGVIARAFADHPHSDGSEVSVVQRLRACDALSVSLVAEQDGAVIGYVAASPVEIAGRSLGWFGLGPVAVDPPAQGMGVGILLVNECLARLRRLGARGCVVLGEPDYYGRFGFKTEAGLTYEGPPPEYFMALTFGDVVPEGAVAYHPAFGRED